MENQSKPILIPTDFTVVARYAIEAAMPFAKLTNSSIVLVHIVKKISEIPDATARVELEADKASRDHGIHVTGIVREGSIFSTIGETVTELDAGLVLMGTHGIRGMQKLTGSWALKVIVTSKVPIIVVQTYPRKTTVDRIAFPIDFKRENREKIGWAYYVAKLFNSKVYIFRSEPSKDRKIEQGVRTNLVFTEKFLRSKNIKYEISVAQGEDSFAKESLQYAEEIDADMVMITTTKGISIADFVLGTSEEDIITNSAHIPVMCVNPRKSKVGGFSATGG
ncbi:MAG: universal stress protein [Bacteroidales bacterium]|jgi:nucleotide-binding universal stress UspA family protein|nr:universal stress protein [Bacteroidales bacterium]